MTHRRHEWFDVAELEVNSRCNRACGYCPNATEGFVGRETRMSDALFKRIIGMLGEICFSGRLSFHRFNEPLLRKDLAAIVAVARRELPLAFIVIYTNGDLLNDERYQELIAAGVDNFLVTRHDSDDFPERPFQFVQHPSNFALSGRGGIVSRAAKSLTLPCYAPSEMMIVRTNGDVVLCHEDALAETVLGNLVDESLEEVWSSERALELRSQLRQGDRARAGGPCALCDCRLHPLPGGAI
jgi:2-deoxy-scyllo-inosamine dehydrogenase (SAM-dependent)